MPFATSARDPLHQAARLVSAIGLALATLLTALPAPAAALEPPRPLPDYRPAFVTETDTRPWTDCLWASGAMLLDKWTNGDVRVTRQALRAASGDHRGGSQFKDLTRAFAHYGFDLRWSPDGRERLTFGQLLSRLEKGAGAVVLGDDHKLPRWYGRWDYAFWKKKGEKDNHAVYIERYDRKHGRVWLMDPLGRGDWQGEWISVWAIQRFTWSRGGAVFAAVTPTAKAAPFAKVKAAATPKMVLSKGSVDAAWKLKAPKRWRFPGADVKAVFERAADPMLAAALSPDMPVKTAGTAAASSSSSKARKATVSVSGKTLHLSAPLPTKTGAYTLHVNVTDRRFGRSFVAARDIAVFIPGERRATIRLVTRQSGVEAGIGLKVSVNVANSGKGTWAGSWSMDAGAGTMSVERGTRAVARWIRLADDGTAFEGKAPKAVTFVLAEVPLEAGEMQTLHEVVTAPTTLGHWALVVDVVDDVDGSYAAMGSEPGVLYVDVVAPRGRDDAE